MSKVHLLSPLLVLMSGSAAHSQSIALQACDVTNVAGDVPCGSLEVPENPAAPSGRKIALNLVLLKAAAAKPEPDPLVILQGGPEQGATRLADFYARVMSNVRERRDIVPALVTPRPSGR